MEWDSRMEENHLVWWSAMLTPYFFQWMFIKSCEKRMGWILKQDMALLVDIISVMVRNLEEVHNDREEKEYQRISNASLLIACLVIGFCLALWDSEISMVILLLSSPDDWWWSLKAHSTAGPCYYWLWHVSTCAAKNLHLYWTFSQLLWFSISAQTFNQLKIWMPWKLPYWN